MPYVNIVGATSILQVRYLSVIMVSDSSKKVFVSEPKDPMSVRVHILEKIRDIERHAAHSLLDSM